MGIWNIPKKSCTYPWSLRLPPVQFTRVMVASLVSAPATRAVYQSVCHIFCACPLAVGQVDFQNGGVCACRRCSPAGWLSDPWSLRLPPVQFTGVFAHNVVMFQYDASGFCGHVVLNGSHAGLSWDCSLCLAMLFVIHLFWCALRLIKQVMPRIQRCQWFSFAKLKCCNASKAHWSHELSAFTIITISIWMSVCSVWKTDKRDTIYVEPPFGHEKVFVHCVQSYFGSTPTVLPVHHLLSCCHLCLCCFWPTMSWWFEMTLQLSSAVYYLSIVCKPTCVKIVVFTLPFRSFIFFSVCTLLGLTIYRSTSFLPGSSPPPAK